MIDRNDSMRIERKSLTLREKAADMLRQAIVENRFPPGKHLIERELCDLLGVSRTSIREALRHLESEQLIKMVPHKGPTVATLSVHDAEDLYQVRGALEGLAGELFALKATEAQISELCATAEEMNNISEKENPGEMISIVSKFYRIIFDGAQNPVCAQFVKSLNTRISMLRRMSLASEGRHNIMMNEVYAIIEAAKERDPIKLKQACIAHVDGAYLAVLPQLKKNEEEENLLAHKPS